MENKINLIYEFDSQEGIHKFYFIGQLLVEYCKMNRACLMHISNDPNVLEEMTLRMIDLRSKNLLKNKSLESNCELGDTDRLHEAIGFFKERRILPDESKSMENYEILLGFVKGIIKYGNKL